MPALISIAILIASCAPSALEGGFDSPNPAAKLYAIERAVREQDRRPETLASIVEQLDSDDPAVRMLAIAALERLTGETRGYEHDAPRDQRRAAVYRWRDYVRSLGEGRDAVEAREANHG